MPARSISYIKFMFVFAKLEAPVTYTLISVKQNALC